MSGPYFDTTSLAPDELVEATQIAAGQDDVILAIFQRRKGPFTPSHVLTICQLQGKRYLLTSVRRSMSNLTKRNLLVRTDEKRMGPFHRVEYCWSLA